MIYSKYPPNWQDVSRRIRRAANWKCEYCGAKHGEPHPVTGSTVILTTHHIGVDTLHPPKRGNPDNKLDCRDENLVCLCQKDHLAADAEIRKLGNDYQNGHWFKALASLALARSLTRKD